MYRAAALALLEKGGAASERAEELEIELGDRVIANGRDVTEAIRTPEVSEAASRIATNEKVRAALVEKQRALLADGDWVAEGRDIGTVVAPDAAVKVFLTADPEERAQRRAEELGTDVETVLRDQALRDAQDESREHSPLQAAPATRWSSTPPASPSTRSWSASPSWRRRGAMSHGAPKVAVVGYPNVGKSTLVNRLSDTREAVVHEQAGVTRDRKEVEADWNGRSFLLWTPAAWTSRRRRPGQRRSSARRAPRWPRPTVAVFVVDAARRAAPGRRRAGARAARRRRAGDGGGQQGGRAAPSRRRRAEFYGLGLGDPVPVSAAHGLGTGDLLDAMAERLPESPGATEQAARLAVIGRPNVGKSSLVNKLLGEERVIVADVAGTTRDSIDTRIEFDGRPVMLVDTAGLRRRTKVAGTVDYYAQLRSERAAERAAVAIVMCDAVRGRDHRGLPDRRDGDEEELRHGDRPQQVGRSRHRPRGRHGTGGDQKLRQRPRRDGGVGRRPGAG